jgi:hypothetical protein
MFICRIHAVEGGLRFEGKPGLVSGSEAGIEQMNPR